VVAVEEKVDQAIAKVEPTAEATVEAEEPPLVVPGGPRAKAKPSAKPTAKATAKAAPRPGDAANMSANNAKVALNGVMRYLDMQSKANKVPLEEIARLQERVKAGQERVETAQKEMKANADRIQSRGLVAEVEKQVAMSEAAVEQFLQAMQPLLKESDEEAKEGGDTEEAPKAKGGEEGEAPKDGKAEKEEAVAAAVKEAEKDATRALTGSKTMLAVKRVASKRLAESVAKSATEELDALQTRTDVAQQKLLAVKKEVADKKYVKAKEEVLAKFGAAEEAVKMAISLAEGLSSAADEGEGEEAAKEMDIAVERGLKAQQDAQTQLSAVRSALQAHLRDMKAGESSVQAEFSQLLVKVGPLQADLDKQKKAMSEREQKMVAAKLLKEAASMFETLDAKIDKASAAAAPLIGDTKEDFTGAMFLGRCFEALNEHLRKAKKTKDGLFDEIRGSDSGVSEAKFVEFMKALPELKAQDGAPMAEAQFKAAYDRMDDVGGGQVAARQFEVHFRSRFVVVAVLAITDQLSVDSGKVIRKLEANEVVEALADPEKDEKNSITRVKVRAEKDGTEGWVAMAGNQGTVFLVPYSAYEACTRKIEDSLQELLEAVNETMAMLKTKADDLSKKSSLGPLGEAKAELMKMRVRASKAQTSHSTLKKKIAEAQKGHAEQLEKEKARREEVAEKVRAATMVEEATILCDAAAEQAEKAAATAEALVATPSGDDNPLQVMDEATVALVAAEALVSKALDKVMKENMNEIRKVEKGPFVEARRLMFRLKVKLAPLETRLKKAVEALQGARGRVAGDAQRAVADALRASARQLDMTADALFAKLSQGAAHVAASALRTHLESVEGEARLKASQLELGLHGYKAGVTRLGLLAMLQEYKRCVKDIALTTAFEVKTSGTIRKLEKGELLEVLGGVSKDETVGLERVRCRALQDRAEGWVTVKGNQGTLFIENAEKPYMILKEAAAVQKENESGSDDARAVEAGEVMEVLEGPRKEAALEVVRVRGKARKDGKMGWVTLKDRTHTEPALELTKLMICKGTIALTTAFDIASCNAIRKIEVGEMMEQIEAPKVDEDKKMTRVHIRCSNDGKEGWATMKGNQGTVYIAESMSHHSCRRSVPLEAAFASGSKVHRTLEAGEIFEVLEGPSTETKEGDVRFKGRSLRSGREGWLPMTKVVQPWNPRHLCKKPTALRETQETESKALRQLAEGEIVEALDAPAAEAGGALLLRVRTDRDGLVGYAQVHAADAKEAFLEPIATGAAK